jgi:hypothetical protein
MSVSVGNGETDSRSVSSDSQLAGQASCVIVRGCVRCTLGGSAGSTTTRTVGVWDWKCWEWRRALIAINW